MRLLTTFSMGSLSTARFRASNLPITCHQMFHMPKSIIDKFYPNFAIGLLVDPSSEGTINEMRREWNTKFGNSFIPWRGIRLIFEIHSKHLESSRDILSQFESKYTAFEMKLEAPFITPERNGVQRVFFYLSSPPSFASLVDELGKHFDPLQREMFRTPGTKVVFPQKPKNTRHWSISRLHHPVVLVYNGQHDAAEQVFGELQKMHLRSAKPFRAIGLKLWYNPRERTGEGQSSAPEYSAFYLEISMTRLGTMVA